ncbi:OLC1v1035649C1 [Oldenlandia corymbosa var. corymbosa]|uniref:OLC1v1035649C1 n=1 Tax=Oldenlandia corymbosa var. corymbosa TaxID=529605 RepID=A0AAV1CTZ7_OLDCO|nr:OLC1v1035649C1 [Oldenlandia corymbosa var. corymbosa]
MLILQSHAALVHLMRLLEGELIKFSCRVLREAEERARDDEVVNHDLWELANDLLAANEEFRKIFLASFIDWRKKLNFPISGPAVLLPKLRVLNHDTLNRIKVAAEDAGESIEGYLAFLRRSQCSEKKDFVEYRGIHDLLSRITGFLDNALKEASILEEIQVEKTASVLELHDDDSQTKSSRRSQIQRPWRGCLDDRTDLDWEKTFPFELFSAVEMDEHDFMSGLIDEVIERSSELKVLKVWEISSSIGKPTSQKQFFAVQSLHVTLIGARVDHISGQSREDTGEFLSRSLKGKKYLIVLEGLRNFEVWETIQEYFPDDGVGSRILLRVLGGLGSSSIVSQLKESYRLYKPELVFWCETKRKGGFVKLVGKKLGFDTRWCMVDLVGLSGGMALGWGEEVIVLGLETTEFSIEVEFETKETKRKWKPELLQQLLIPSEVDLVLQMPVSKFGCDDSLKLSPVKWDGITIRTDRFTEWWGALMKIKKGTEIKDIIEFTVYLLWYIWKARIAWQYEGKSTEAVEVVQRAMKEWGEFKHVQVEKKGRQNVETNANNEPGWEAPGRGKVRVNVSSHLDEGKKVVGLGICIRDDEGKLKCAKSVLHECVQNSMAAELEAVRSVRSST